MDLMPRREVSFMNTLIQKFNNGLKIILLGGIIGILGGQAGYAQNAPLANQPPSPPNMRTYPGTAGTVPVVEVTAYQYFPTYFWYFADYLYLITDYLWYFYEQSLGDITGTGPYAEAITVMSNATNLTVQSPLNWATGSANTTSLNSLVQTSTMGLVSLDFSPAIGNFINAIGIAIPGTDIQAGSDNSPFSFDTLFEPIAYSTTQQGQAVSYINFVLGNYNNPPQALTLSTKASALQAQLANQSVTAYILAYRNFVAAQSVAYSNLNYLYNERLVNTSANLGSQAGMSTLPTDKNTGYGQSLIAQASPLQVQQWMIQRRLNNSTWFTEMNNATSLQIARETLFVLAEMEAQLYQLHLDNERLLAATTAMQLQTVPFAKTALSQSQQAAQQAASQAITTTTSSGGG